MLEVDVRLRKGDFKLDASFSAEAGLTALFGRSGAGKSTLINTLAGLERPDAGKITIDGTVLFDAAKGIDVPVERRRLGYVFQEARLFPHLTVRGNLFFGRRLLPRAEMPGNTETIIEMLDLGPLLARRPRTLSGGERQRVAIGRALLAAPRILLMDEPLASLDAARKAEILPFIERLRDVLGLPIVYVSHAISEVIRIADTMVVMSDGTVAATGSVEAIMSRLDLYPLTGRYETGAVVAATVCGEDSRYGLSELAVGQNRLWIPKLDLSVGTPLRVRIRARDVALGLEKPSGVSFQNVFEGVIREMDGGDSPLVDILIDIGSPLIARVTRRSVDELGLKPGKRVYALIKAVAIDRPSLGRHGAISRR